MNIFDKRINKPKEMVDPNKLMRGNFLQFGLDRVQVLTIAKKSIRVYNVTQDSYINTWVELRDFEYVPLTSDLVSEIYSKQINGVEIIEFLDYNRQDTFNLRIYAVKFGEIKYAHELQNVVNIFSDDDTI